MRRGVLLMVLLLLASAAQAGGGLFSTQERQWIERQRTVRVAIDPTQWKQFDVDHQQGMNRSLLAGYIDLVGERSGLTFSAGRTDSLQGSIDALRSGEVDVMLVAATMPQMDNQGLLYSRPYYTGATLLITRQRDPLLLELDQLEGRTLAFRGGGGYEAWLRQHKPGIKRLPLDDLDSVLSAVENGVADAAIGLDTSIRPLLRRDYADTLRHGGAVTELPVDVRLVVRQDRAPLLSIIDKSVASITEIEQAELLNRWMRTTYFGAPTLGAIVRHYRSEVLLGISTVTVLLVLLSLTVRAQRAARRSEREKARFVAVMSHEVRNSANTIAASVELLLHSTLAPEQQRLLSNAHAAGENLRSMLNQALDYSRLDAKGVRAEAEPCNVGALVQECIGALEPAVCNKPVMLAASYPEGAVPVLMLDATGVRQVMTNLLTNAVKFTDDGRIDVTLCVRGLDSRKPILHLDVHDTGIGIPLEQQAQLFKPFSRVNAHVAEPLGGAGLGLSICHGIVAQLGGTIRFSSTVGVGTSFHVEIPVTAVTVTAKAAPAPACRDPSRAPARRVLLIEDHPGNREVILDQLRYLGLHATAAEAGTPGVERYRAGSFDAVLLDCNLPDISGYDVARRLREIERREGRPPAVLIAISASVEQQHRIHCRESGMDIVLTKPLPLPTLRDALGLPESAAAPASAAAGLSDGSAFLGEWEADLDAIATAIGQQDLAVVAYHGHRIRGAALIAGQPAMARTAGDLCGFEHGDEDLWQEVTRLHTALRGMVAAV